MRRWGLLLVFASLLPGAASAQAFDCAKARSSIERAICAQPSLGALDRSVAEVYAQALARPQADAAALRAGQLAYLRDRDAGCNVAAPQLAACLARSMNARIAALSPPANLPGATSPIAPLPRADATPPAIPSGANPPQAAAELDHASVPASGSGEALLRVTGPGRFSISAHSTSGAALQLVDMMAGPGEVAGAPGAHDGRIDELLDVGTYKIRVMPAEHATGDVQLTVVPFRDARPPAATPNVGELFTGSLDDLQQAGFWLSVGPEGDVQIDATGRALADLRLWRGGTELVALNPAERVAEPVRGHPMSGMRLSGKVEPGTYLAVAYGGAKLPWPDGTSGSPFYLRSGASPLLADGFAGGTIGPTGSEMFAAPARAGLFRLDLPSSALAGLSVDGQSAAIAANSRAPHATLSTAPNRKLVEVTGTAGQPYALRAQETSIDATLTKPGRYWVSASAVGAGGDEVPPTLLLAQIETGHPIQVRASTVPRVGPGSPWRTQFNVRGPTTLLFLNSGTGDIVVRNASQGLGALHWQPERANRPAGYVEQSMNPIEGKQGVADLLFGTANAPTPPAPVKWPADPIIPFGVQTVTGTQTLALDGNVAPLMVTGLLARPAPVALAEGPLIFAQMPGVTLDVPVIVAPGGTLSVSDPMAGPIAAPVRAAADRSLVISLPAPDQPRTVVIARHVNVLARAAIPAPPAPTAGLALGTSSPRFLDLRRDEARTLDLSVAEGGLYRVETLGRLHMSAAIGTAFLPTLDTAEANGVGQNALLQRWLRAGHYRVRVTASESAGHLGILASKAPLVNGATLLPGGSVRARLPGGTGLGIPIEIAEAGKYRIELRGLDRTFDARLDDDEGWPLTAPGPLTTLEREFATGHYRLLVSPAPVDVQVVARLTPIVPVAEIAGHGPHALVPGATVQASWREPAGRDDPRAPDVWTFELAGIADATLRISAGMDAKLIREGVERPVARIVGPAPYHGPLEAGRYRIEATSLGRNDRLDYRLTISTAELQPGVPREVAADAQVPFTLAEPRVISLTSFGPVALKAVLRTGTREALAAGSGEVVGRYGERGDDWNIAISRLLPAGAYRLDLAPSVPPSSSNATLAAEPPALPEPGAADKPGDDDATAPDPDPGEPAAQTKPGDRASGDATDSGDKPDTPEAPETPKIELTLALPAMRDPVAAPVGAANLIGGGVHRLAVPAPEAGQLLLATAQSSVPVVLALERDTGGTWRTVAIDTGTAPVVAAPTDGDPAAWRLATWPVDGGALPIAASVKALAASAQAPGVVDLRPVDNMATPVAVARLAIAAPGPVLLSGGELLAGGWAGHALAPADDGIAVPQAEALWLMARTPGPVRATVLQAAPNVAMSVPVPVGTTARLAATAPAAGVFRAWRAEAGSGQAGLDAGQGMGVAAGSTLAAGTAPVRIWDAAGSTEILRPRVTPLDLTVLPAQRIDAALNVLLPPNSALPLTLPDGERRTDLALAAGVGAVAGQGESATTVWTGETAEARSVPGNWTELVLLNTTAQPAPAAVSWTMADMRTLRPGNVIKQFFGASGSLDLPVEAPAGAKLVLVGDATAVFVGADGRVQRGQALTLSGPGRLTVAHAPGPIAVWLDIAGSNAWPAAELVSQAIPATVPLQGPAMVLALTPGGPMLLHARTTAPVIVRLGDAPPVLYPAGAVLSQYVAGPVQLRVDSAHDGPLSGTLELTADPVIQVADGLGAPVALAPGDAAVFAFQVPRATEVGVGVRADPDRVRVRLLAADGGVLGEGSALLRRLEAGRYLIEARLPPDAPASVVRPAVVGIAPRTSGPPPEIAHSYLELVGLAPKDSTP